MAAYIAENKDLSETLPHIPLSIDPTSLIGLPLAEHTSGEHQEPLVHTPGYAVVNDDIVVLLPGLGARLTTEGSKPFTLEFGRMNLIDVKDIKEHLAHKEAVPIRSPDSMSLQQLEASEPSVRDADYYFSMVLFETDDDVQFLVPRYRFLANPDAVNFISSQSQQQNEDSIVHLGVPSQDFQGIMELMYPLATQNLQQEHWISILKLSTRWMMLGYRQQAIAALEWKTGNRTCSHLSPDQKIVLGKTCGIPAWFRQGCLAFASGEVHLEPRHERSLGIDLMVKITHARDKAFNTDMCAYHIRQSTTPPPSEDILVALFEDMSPNDFVEMSIVQRILLAREQKNYDWLRACYLQLIDREESISLAEAVSLELDTVTKLWKARYELLCKYRRTLQVFLAAGTTLDFASAIEAEFAYELDTSQALRDLLDPPIPPSAPVETVPQPEPDPYPSSAKKKKKKKRYL